MLGMLGMLGNRKPYVKKTKNEFGGFKFWFSFAKVQYLFHKEVVKKVWIWGETTVITSTFLNSTHFWPCGYYTVHQEVESCTKPQEVVVDLILVEENIALFQLAHVELETFVFCFCFECRKRKVVVHFLLQSKYSFKKNTS